MECGTGDGQGPCYDACTVQVCGGSVVYPFFMACADCLNASCCTPWSACESNSFCSNHCMYDDPSSNPQCCQAGSLYHAVDACIDTSCANECGPGVCGG
jgi:hypothetical protein